MGIDSSPIYHFKMAYVGILKNTNKLILESNRGGNGNDKTNEKKNRANDKKDKNMKVTNVSRGGMSPLKVENTKDQGKKL